MPLTSSQIVTLACQDAKCPGFISQAGQLLNAILQDLCMNWDLDAALGSFGFNFNSATGNGSGPYTLPNDYLRAQVTDGKDEFFYTIQGVPYPLIQITKAEYDWMVQTPGFSSFPYNYATDLSQTPPQLFVWPPASGSYPCILRYYRLMPDIATPETSAVVPWFPNTMILQRGLAGRLMGLTGDKRQPEYLGGGGGDSADKYPLGFMTLLSQYLKNAKDREGAVKTVGKDRRRWGRPFDQLKNTKNIGWLVPLVIAAGLYLWPAQEAHANCTAPCTKTQVISDINTNWPDNTTGQITPALLRSTVLDLVNSYLDVNGASTFTCTTHQFLVSIATLSSYSCSQPAFTDISGTALLAQGGTSQVTAAAARASLGLNIDAQVSNGDSNLSIAATTRTLVTSASFTASRTWTLPTSASVNPGQLLTVCDQAQGITSTNTLVLAANGADTIIGHNGSITSVTLTIVGSCLTLIADGVSKWNMPSSSMAPSIQIATSGSSTFTTPVAALYCIAKMVGGGGGGAGAGTSPPAAMAGGNSTLGALTANGGALGSTTAGTTSAGGTVTGCNIATNTGGPGGGGTNQNQTFGGNGGGSRWGAGSSGGFSSALAAAATNPGSGGGGGGQQTTANGGGGGAAGGYCEHIYTNPIPATLSYSVGAGGAAGTAGTGGEAGAAGASGRIEYACYFQ